MRQNITNRYLTLLCCYCLFAAFPVAGGSVGEVIPNEDVAVSRLVNRLLPYSGRDRLESCLEGCRSLGVVFSSSCVDRCLSCETFPYSMQTPAATPLRLGLVEQAAEQLLSLVKTYLGTRVPMQDQNGERGEPESPPLGE